MWLALSPTFSVLRLSDLELTPPASLWPYCLNPFTADPVKALTLPYWSKPVPPFLIFDIRALWRSVPECQKLKMVAYTSMALKPSNSSSLEHLALKVLTVAVVALVVQYFYACAIDRCPWHQPIGLFRRSGVRACNACICALSGRSPLSIPNEWSYFNETGHSWSLASTDENDDTEKVKLSEWCPKKNFGTRQFRNRWKNFTKPISYGRATHWLGFEGHGFKSQRRHF